MTSALIGGRPVMLDDAAGDLFGWVGRGAGAAPDEPGSEVVPGAAELRASPLLDDTALLVSAEEMLVAGPALPVCPDVQPEARTSAAVAAPRILRADRFRTRCDRMRLFILASVGRTHLTVPFCMARRDDGNAVRVADVGFLPSWCRRDEWRSPLPDGH